MTIKWLNIYKALRTVPDMYYVLNEEKLLLQPCCSLSLISHFYSILHSLTGSASKTNTETIHFCLHLGPKNYDFFPGFLQ